MIKDLGIRVESVWQGLRPATKQMIVGALKEFSEHQTSQPHKATYDTQSDWELGRLLSALDEQSRDASATHNSDKLREINMLSDACAAVLEQRTRSAEAFIQLAMRALERADFRLFDRLADILGERFPAPEIAEIIRQDVPAQIRAVASETLATMPLPALLGLLTDPIYYDIAKEAIELQAIEYENDDARWTLEAIEHDEKLRA
jgi:hypothetical protein